MTAPVAAAPDARAAQTHARIQIPRRLPDRHDGRPIRHLSNSSYTTFLACPERWRRKYIQGERTPPSGAMFIGSRVDDALTGYYRRQLEHGDVLAADQVLDLLRDRWHDQLEAERDRQGVEWEPELPEPAAYALARDAVTATLDELVPRLGRPVAVQRKLEFKLSPGVEWTIQCYLDLETVCDDDTGATPAPAIVDYKVKSTPVTQAKADRDPQAGLYLAARWLEGSPAREFTFAQVAKPGARRKQLGTALVTTSRTIGQQRASLARIAQAAGQIHALHERFGPDQPWGYADPTGWACTPRFCSLFESCIGGDAL